MAVLTPRPTYDGAIVRLNSCNLGQALELVSTLSAVEFENGFGSIPSLLNAESARLIAEAVIKSKAAWYKQRQIEPSDLHVLFNGAKDALDDKRLQQEVVSGGERQDMLYKMQRYFSRLAYVQIRPQQTPFIALGRTLAILEVIPNQHLENLPAVLQRKVSDFSGRTREVLGMSVSDIVKVHLSVMDYFGRFGRLLIERLPTISSGRKLNAEQQARALMDLFVIAKNNRHLSQLTKAGFHELGREKVGNDLRSYAAVFGRQIASHRELLGRKEFHVGIQEHCLSPLDRFPLVASEDGEGWYVPNVRGFARTASEVIHFTLNELCRNDYEAVRGPLLEAYLQLMFKNRAPRLTVIPERRWSTSKGGVDGPDLLIIDHSADSAVIAVEVKSRRMVLDTRYELLDKHLAQNYTDLWQAIKQLPSKVSKALSLAGEYGAYSEDLIAARTYPVYHLGIVGEAPYLFGELVEYRRLRDPEFPLYGFTEPYGVMSVDTFERMLEVSVQGDRPIAGILREYLEDCKNMELSSSMAEDFRHPDLMDDQYFGFSFLEPLWP